MDTDKQKPFRDWLKRELFIRDWSMRHLGSITSYSHSHIANVVNGKMDATFEFCAAVAKAFNEASWRLFIMAGLMEPPGEIDLDEETSFIVDIYRQMDQEHRKEIYEYVSWYGIRHKQDEENEDPS